MLTRMTEEDWATVLEVFRACRSRRGAKGRNDRIFLEAVHSFCVHNITWRALPAATCDPPLRRVVSFLGSCLQRLNANHFAPSGIPHRGHGAVKHIGETATIRPLQAGRHESS